MSRAAVVYSNLADAGTVTAGSALLLTSPALVQNEHVARKWRSLSSSTHLLIDLGSAQSLDTAALIGLTAETIRCRVSATDDTGLLGEIHDSGVVAVDQDYLQAIFLRSTAATGRFVRFDLSHSGLDYVEAGRAVVGLRSTFGYNFNYGWGREFVDRSLRTKTRGGQTQISPERTHRRLEMSFETVQEADALGFLTTIDRVNALQRDLLMIANPDSTNLARDTVWGLVAEPTAITQPHFDLYSKNIVIEERL